MPIILETERLILRAWHDDDLELMLDINQDPKVMEYFSSVLGLAETDLLIQKIRKHYYEHSFKAVKCITC